MEARAASMTLHEACGGAPECVENLEAALKVHGAMFGDADDRTLIIRREVRPEPHNLLSYPISYPIP